MRKFFFIISLFVGALSCFGQSSSYKINAETNNGTKLVINTSDLKEVIFDNNELYLSGTSLESLLNNIQSTIDGLNTKITKLQSDIELLKSKESEEKDNFNERYLLGSWSTEGSYNFFIFISMWSNNVGYIKVGKQTAMRGHWTYDSKSHVFCFDCHDYAFTVKALSNRVLSAEFYYGGEMVTKAWSLGNSGIDPNYRTLIVGRWLSDKGDELIITDNNFQYIDSSNTENNIEGEYTLEVIKEPEFDYTNNKYEATINLKVGDLSIELTRLCGGRINLAIPNNYSDGFYYQE